MQQKPLNPGYGVAVFTDGSAHVKDRSGGWSWVALDAFDGLRYESGHCSQVTNNQMELHAVGRAIYDIAYDLEEEGHDPQQHHLLVYSDSQYVVLGWNDKKRKRKKNHQEWYAAEQHRGNWASITLTHVKGHDGQEFNELADRLAGEARKQGVNGNSEAEGV